MTKVVTPPPAPAIAATTPAIAVYNGPRWDYKFLRAEGPVGKSWEDAFDKLGEEGWEFVGKCSHGRSIFKRPA